MKEYIINKNTLVVIPLDDKSSRVVELKKEFIVYKSVLNIIKKSCIYYGSSYNGRVYGSKYMLNKSSKIPIIISEINNLIIFPTKSPRNKKCCWLLLNNIKHYNKIDINQTIIRFSCGKSMKIGVSYRIIDNQVLQSSRLKYILDKKT